MSSVFISYSRSDAIVADKLAVELERLNGKESVWIDRDSIPFTADWWVEIQRGIESADNFLLILSPNSIGSPVCHLEIEHARRLGKRVVPLAHRAIEQIAARKAVMTRVAEDAYVNKLLGDRNPMSLFDANWLAISQFNWVGFAYDAGLSARNRANEVETEAEQAARLAEEARFQQQFLELRSALETDMAHVRQHTRLTQRAREWEAGGRSEALLLEGEEVVNAAGWLAAWEQDKKARAAQTPAQAPKLPEPTDLQREYIATSQLVDARKRRVLRWLRIGTAVLSVTAVVALIFAVVFGRSAASTREEAGNANATLGRANATLSALYPTSTAIANQLVDGAARIRALNLLAAAEQEQSSGNAMTAMLLAIRSMLLAPTENGADMLERSLRMNFAAWYAPETALGVDLAWDSGESIAFGPDGRSIVVTGSGIVSVLDHDTGRLRSQRMGSTAAYSASGSVIVAASDQDETTLTNIDTGQLVATIAGQSAVFSPGGSYIAAVVVADDTVYTDLFDPVSGAKLARFAGEYPIFTPDDRFMLTQESFKVTRLWSLESKTELLQADGYSGAISADGKHFVTIDANVVELWDVATGESVKLVGHQDAVLSAAFSADGTKLVTAAGQRISQMSDKTAIVWDVATGEPLLTLRGKNRGFSNAIFSPDGRFIVTTDDDGMAIVWDANTGQQLHVLAGHADAVLAAAISPDSRYVATLGSDGVMLWDLRLNDPRLLQLQGNAIHATHAEFSPDGRQIVTGSIEVTGISYDTDEFDNFKAILWDAQTGARLSVLSDRADWAAFDRSGNQVAVSDPFYWSDGSLFSGVRNLVTDERSPLKGATATFSDGGRYVYTTEVNSYTPEKGTIRFYDAATLKYVNEVNYFNGGIISASMSPDETLLATAAEDGKIILWNVPGGTISTYLFQDGADLTDVQFSPDSSKLASSRADGSVTIWNVETWQIERQFFADLSKVNDVSFSPDGKLLATTGEAASGQAQAILWDFATGQRVRAYQGHRGPINSIRFSADGRLLITAGADATVQVWNASYDGLIQYACERVSHLRDLTGTESQRLGTDPWPSCEKQDASRAPVAVTGSNRGTLTAGRSDVWRFAGTSGQMIAVDVIADDPARLPGSDGGAQSLDSFVTVFEPDFSAYVSNDDIEPNVNTNSRIDRFRLTRAGEYVIVVSSLDGQTGGGYSLDIQPLSEAASPAPEQPATATFTPMPTLTPTPPDLGG